MSLGIENPVRVLLGMAAALSGLVAQTTTIDIPTQARASGVVAGTYGSSMQVARITVDDRGRILTANNVTITGSSSDLVDCKVTASGSTATVPAPCRLRIGSAIHSLPANVTATLSGTAASGTVFIYWDGRGQLVADENSTATLSCTAPCTVASTGGFPWAATPIASVAFTNNVFGTVTDHRSVYSAKSVWCGIGLTCTENGATGEQTISADTTAVLLSKTTLQSGQVVRCVSSGAGSVHTCEMNPALSGYTGGMVVEFTATAAAITGPATLNINGLGAKPIKRADGSADPAANDLAQGVQVPLRYDGSVFRLPPSGMIAPGSNGRAFISDSLSPSGTAWADRSLAGTFGALPACAGAQNGLVYLFTNSLYSFARCDGSAWSYFHDGRVAAPPSGAWSWDNQIQGGSAALDVSRGFHLLSVPPAHTTGYAVRHQTAPSGSYSRTFALRLRALWGQDNVGYMAGFRDTAGKLHALNLSFASGTNATFYLIDVRRQASAATVTASAFDFGPTPVPNLPQTLYLKITDDTANISFAYSVDGYDFHTLFTGPRAAYLGAPDQIFFAASANGAAMGAALSVISIQ